MPNKTRGIRKADINHRKQYEKFVLSNGDPTVSNLIVLWNYWNTEYFDGSFKAPPIILLAEPSKPSRLGDYSPMGAYGTRSQIRIRPSLLTGTHPHMLPGDEYKKGRFLFVSDVCLHETIHLWQDEVRGDLEPAYHGHGPLFRDKCNEIGAKLGLAPVRTCKKRGKDAELPSCSHFPHNVRPQGYYQGAYVRDHEEPKPLKGRLERLLRDFTGDEIVQELRVMGVLETCHPYKGQNGNPIKNLSAVSIADVLQTGENRSTVEQASEDQASLKHEWFLDAFESACAAKGITSDVNLSPALTSTVDDWLSQRLSKKRYIGNRAFFEEKPHHFKEKIHEIVSEWESLRTSGLGKRIGVPPFPDLEFLIINREAIFTWVSEQRRRSMDRIFAQFETKAASAHTH
ncbi:MAG: hypothetical protein ACLP5H_23380 [Desulfomonilaceae bacterium]